MGIVDSLASEIIEPPAAYMGTDATEERLNNLTSAHRLGIEVGPASEIIEPPRVLSGYRVKAGRGSIIPPAALEWVTRSHWLVRLLNPPGKHALTCIWRGLCRGNSDL